MEELGDRRRAKADDQHAARPVGGRLEQQREHHVARVLELQRVAAVARNGAEDRHLEQRRQLIGRLQQRIEPGRHNDRRDSTANCEE